MTRNITIFEGPDGGGKSTAAKAYAASTGARYIHCTAMPNVGRGIAHMYVEAMLPALLGYQDVVLDRCWLSELPYGVAFRDSAVRLTPVDRLMLERIAMRCATCVVMCLPPFETVRRNYRSRKHMEMLNNEDQLEVVYDMYNEQNHSLPQLNFDYTEDAIVPEIEDWFLGCRSENHPLELQSSGNLASSTMLVGYPTSEKTDFDAHSSWPGVSFDQRGHAQWFVKNLSEFLCVGENQDLSKFEDLLFGRARRKIVALGSLASKQLTNLGVKHTTAPQPQFWNRESDNVYPLFKVIK